MTTPYDIIRAAEAMVCHPTLRHVLAPPDWQAMLRAASGLGWAVKAHWADTGQAHALLLDPRALALVLISTPVEQGRYPALSAAFPAASLYERMVRDLWGHAADGGCALRPWLDHGAWPRKHPMAPRPHAAADGEPDDAADAGDDPPAVIPLGPVWGLIEEAAHIRLTVDGPAIRHADSRLGFTHKGTLALMRGKPARAAARFVARLSADATVAHCIAFAEATEAASDTPAPPRAVALRVVMQEIERIAGHLTTLAEVALLADAVAVHTRCSTLREVLLRASEAAFGHRLMMDCVVPGGVAVDIAAGGHQVILRALGNLASQVPAIRLSHDSPALADRLVGAGAVQSGFVGGVAGRACGDDYDSRRFFSAGYRAFSPRVAIAPGGDAAARQLVRLAEIEESLMLVSTALDKMPNGPLTVALPRVSGEGIACAESVRGDIWHWLRLDHGQIAASFPADPGWALWPVAERALQGAAVEDVDLIRASFALPASGMDL